MKEFRLGVLFVHGIGSQPPRDTLVRWGDVLLKVIGRATEAEPGRTIPIIGRADAGDRSGDKPAEVAVEFRSNDREQSEKWLLAEGWWADSFPAPTYSELVSWSFRAVPWAVALHIAQRYWQTDPKASKGAWLRAGAKAAAVLLGAMALTPLFMILLALTLVLGLLPIPELRSLILTTQTMLLGTVGDSLAFVESPLRAALIRGRILEGLERLKDRCERTVIVAHSQGAAATLDALGGILDHDKMGESPTPSAEGPVPDALVTFGSGVNQLVSLKVLSAGRLQRKTGTNAASAAVMATLGTIILLGFIVVSIRSHSVSIEELVRALMFFLAFWGGCALAGWGAYWMLSKLATWGVFGARQQAVDTKTALSTTIVIMFASLALVYYLSKDLLSFLWDVRTGNVMLLVVMLGNLASSMWMILSPATRRAVTEPVQHPPGLPRWMDMYSSADPVPNGPTRIEATSAEVTSLRVWNRGALLSDHMTYWENLDGFVLRVARICAETAGSPWCDKLPPAMRPGWLDRRARRRVCVLRCTVWGNRMLWVLAFYLLWTRHGARVPVPFGFPSWFWDWGPTVERFAIVAAVVALAGWIAVAALRWRWSAWVRADQELVLAQKTAGVMTWPSDPSNGLGTVLAVLAALGLALALGIESEVGAVVADQQFWLIAPVMILMIMGVGVWISLIALWVLRAPQPLAVEDENIGPPEPHPSISSQASMPPRSEA